MTSTVTTGSALVLAGDFSKYVIVDHMGGPSLEYVENVVDGSGIPTGTRGWIFWNRVGADCPTPRTVPAAPAVNRLQSGRPG